MQRVERPVMTTGLERIAAKARDDRKLKFTSLAHHVTEELVWESVNHIPNNSAPGCDGQTVEEAKQSFKHWAPEMIRAIHDQGYRPPPILRVFIPKPGKKEKRPLGIPCVTDRALQRSVAAVLGAIYEQDFLPCSFGGRPGLGAHHALATLGEILSRAPAVGYLLDADLKNYFGSLDHGWLLRFLDDRVGDPRVVSLVRRWLKAGILEDGELTANEKGTPQGGSISVLLSNLYLHHGAPGQTWCFQRVKFPPRQEVQPPHRESSLGSEEVTNRTKRRQSDARAVTKVKQISLVKYLSAGQQHRNGWQAPVGAPLMARWPETAAGSECTARSKTEASRDLGDPLWSRSALVADRVCRTIWLTPEKGRRCSVKSDSLVVLRARESRVHGEAAKQTKTGSRDTSPAHAEAGV
jgi:hypothetical protein